MPTAKTFTIKDGWLFTGDKRVNDLKDVLKVEEAKMQIQTYVEKKLKDQYKMKARIIPFRPSFYNPSVSDNEIIVEDKIWFWKRPESNLFFGAKGKHLMLISDTQNLPFPGVWNDNVFTKTTEEFGSMFSYIEMAQEDSVTFYQTISLVHVGDINDDYEKLTAQFRIENIIRTLFKKDFHRNDEIDIITSNYGSVCIYNFIRRSPSFLFERLGRLIMLNSDVNVHRDLTRGYNILPRDTLDEVKKDNLRDCDIIEIPSILSLLKIRCINFKPSSLSIGSEIPEASTSCGCTCLSVGDFDIGNKELQRTPHHILAFNQLQELVLEEKIYRLRILLFTFLIFTFFCVVFVGKLLLEK